MVSWFFCLSNASCRGLGEIFSFPGLKGGDVCLINQNCHQMHFSNKLNNYLNLKRICWREIGHFAELRYFCPSAWPSQLLINKLLTVLVGWILRCISSSASDLVVQLRRPSQLGERSKRNHSSNLCLLRVMSVCLSPCCGSFSYNRIRLWSADWSGTKKK